MRVEVGVKTASLRYTSFVPLLFVAALIVYKWNAASIAVQKAWAAGLLSTRTDVVSFGGRATFAVAERTFNTFNYFVVVWPALVFGILISAAVRAFISPDWFLRRWTGNKLGAQLVSGAAGAPLMLCSCCVVSIFNAVYERSMRLGPSLAIMLGSPALNPAAIVLTFLLFAPKIAAARLFMAALAVFGSGAVIERLFPNHVSVLKRNEGADAAEGFGRSLLAVSVRTIPVLVIGVICSMLVVEYLPAALFASSSFRSFSVVATATVAVFIAMPTFFEIPLALSLIAAGAPIGAAAALLFAGPVINLPSLLALAKTTNWRIAATLAGLIWTVAVFGGLILNHISI
jgi:uncharacterized membrane protein YraQ (UPF0718 family)